MKDSPLPGAQEASQRLRTTSLRDFSARLDGINGVVSHRRTVDSHEIPVPAIARYALELIGLKSYGPYEKLAWGISFSFQGHNANLSYEKFGLRVYVSDLPENNDAAGKIADQIVKKLMGSTKAIEDIVLRPASNGLFRSGNATVYNQHDSLRRAYKYFRERAQSPALIEDERREWETPGGGSGSSFSSGSIQMQLNSFHDMVAATSAYLSLLEHDMVLALPFQGFDPDDMQLQDFIGLRWADKFTYVFDLDLAEDKLHFDRLSGIVNRWRNTYAHGGFEKGHSSSVFLHFPGIGALPVGLSSGSSKTGLSFIPAGESDIADVFDAFDEMDEWLRVRRLPCALAWIDAGLHIRFDSDFREQVSESMVDQDTFNDFVYHHAMQAERAMNMDY